MSGWYVNNGKAVCREVSYVSCPLIPAPPSLLIDEDIRYETSVTYVETRGIVRIFTT